MLKNSGACPPCLPVQRSAGEQRERPNGFGMFDHHALGDRGSDRVTEQVPILVDRGAAAVHGPADVLGRSRGSNLAHSLGVLAERVRQRSNPDVWDRLVVLIEKTHEADVAETTSRSWATGQSARDQLRLRFARTSRWRLIQ